MQYIVHYQQKPIGIISDPHVDMNMGVAFGSFTPLPAYTHVRNVFLLFTENAVMGKNKDQLKDFYHKRDELHLSMTTLESIPIRTRWIHITDFADKHLDTPYEAEVGVVDVNDFFGEGT